jgi:hypothetical protein
VPWIGAVIAGRYYALGGRGQAAGTGVLAGAAGRVDLAPRFRRTLFGTLHSIGVQVVSGVASANVRIWIYTPDSDGWPSALLWDSGNLDAATFAFREVTSGLPDIDAHPLLWYGIAHDSNPTVRVHAQSDAIEIGGWGTNPAVQPNPGSVIRRTGITLSSPPNPWVFSAAELTPLITPPLVFVRKA